MDPDRILYGFQNIFQISGVILFLILIAVLSVIALKGIRRTRETASIVDMIGAGHIVPLGTLGMFGCWGLGALTSNVFLVCGGTFLYLVTYIILTQMELQSQLERFDRFTKEDRTLLPGEAAFLRSATWDGAKEKKSSVSSRQG
ncbi:MAG: hypothetical protein U9R75_02080 [Candidatus Thermoplasmatota archaeon]|nr:hypothetical protein [Candidatus Thermoplasmatota archaeon]